MGFLSDEAMTETWGDPADLRLAIEGEAATSMRSLLGDCAVVEGQVPGITMRCEFEYEDLRSDELGLGPFGDNTTDVVVIDGTITSITETIPAGTNGYQDQVWQPFHDWVTTQHPEDAAVMFQQGPEGQLTDSQIAESNRLWEQRSREWVEQRLTAERAATGFVEAFAAFDAEAAGAHLASGVPTQRMFVQDVEDYRQAIALYQAMGYELELEPCRQISATSTGLKVECRFVFHVLGSREVGVGPFDPNYFTLTVNGESGLITEATAFWNFDAFMRAIGQPFINWMLTTHPAEAVVMNVDGSPSLTPESLALWEQYRQEYVQHVLAATSPTTAP
jgi:hypothetical protein